MAVSIVELNDFQTLFTGNQEAYGVHIYDTVIEGEKEKGKSFTKTEPIRDAHYADHLNGKQGLGIVPIRKDGTCSFAAIDIDVYDKAITPYLEILYKYDFPLIPFRSKSGGLHLYLFLQNPMKTIKVKGLLEVFRLVLGLNEKVEIFPKQVNLGPGQTGNWINLPYYNAEKTNQYMYNEKGKMILLEEAMEIIKAKLQTEDSLINFLQQLPLSDAPVCLQHIYLFGETNFRNEYLFSLARYYKTKYGDDFEFKVLESNNQLKRPIDTERLTSTVISSHKKRDYSYKCQGEPLNSKCNKEECKRRQYGIGGEEVSDLSYEDFIQYRTDPPYYEWIINTKSLKFYSETDIIQQVRFRALCFRELHILPNRLKETNWTQILNRALQNIQVRESKEGEDISPGTMFKEFLIEFLEKRVLAQNKEQILVDRTFKDEELKAYIFKAKNFTSFLIQQKQFRYYGQTEIQDRLKQLGGTPNRYYVSLKYSTVRVWQLPFEAMKKFIDDKIVDDIKIDFKEEHKDEAF